MVVEFSEGDFYPSIDVLDRDDPDSPSGYAAGLNACQPVSLLSHR